jgi:hypothetical protein
MFIKLCINKPNQWYDNKIGSYGIFYLIVPLSLFMAAMKLNHWGFTWVLPIVIFLIIYRMVYIIINKGG